MTPALSEQALFAEALLCATPEVRAAYLHRACGAHIALRQRVEALLRAAENAGDFLEQLPSGLGEVPVSTPLLGRLNGQVDRTFGDYELLEEIARGGMGIVYKARQKSLNRLVAVKVLLFGQHSSAEIVRRFKIEAVAAGSLHHPNIIAIHEVGVHQGQHFMVVDYVDGPNLSALVGDQPLAAKRAATYVKTIAEAIHYAHERGILHRDLKSSNVLIDSNDQPRVTDFGLARRLEGESSLTLTGQVLGSPNFIPPEQAASHHGKVNRRSDVYGLGAILYHLLTGRPPFTGRTISATIDQVLNSDPLSPRFLNPLVPEDLEAVCLRCLEKKPDCRYGTAQELADELDRFLNGQPVRTQHARRTVFDTTLWANSEYVRGYLEQATNIIPDRLYLFHMVCSFLRHFGPRQSHRLCDLGCGDGALAEYLLKAFPNASLTLVDGAAAMLDAARGRLGNQPNVHFVQLPFDSIINEHSQIGQFDFVVSSFAIHHLNQPERAALFFRLQEMLVPGGWFVNLDTVHADESVFTDWQYSLWREWILEMEKRRPRLDSLRDVPDQARACPDNKLSPLSSQLNALRRAGFEDVDCLYRNGIFVVYCGRVPGVDAIQPKPQPLRDEPSCRGEAPKTLRIGLIGDYHPEITAHRAIVQSLELAQVEVGEWQFQIEWLPTDSFEQFSPAQLSGFDALWCVPASPYVSMNGALKAIQFAREHEVPFLGTCAGFQHVLIEYARNVLGFLDADHEETRPNATCVLVCRLPSPMVEREGQVLLMKGSRLLEIYGRDSSAEMYHCNFGLSRAFEARLENGPLCFSARDASGGVHAVEIPAHPFFVGTLFQPERAALQNQVHPIVRAFIQAALMKKKAGVSNSKVPEHGPIRPVPPVGVAANTGM